MRQAILVAEVDSGMKMAGCEACSNSGPGVSQEILGRVVHSDLRMWYLTRTNEYLFVCVWLEASGLG